MKRRITWIVSIGFVLLGLAAAPAVAAPIWNLDIHHNETNFPPGGVAEYSFDVANVGDIATSGPVTLTINLPGGLARDSVRTAKVTTDVGSNRELEWSCPGSPGDTIVTCTASDALGRHTVDRRVYLRVSVHPAIEPGSERFLSATVSGGGAASPSSAIEHTLIDPEPAGFGIVTPSFTPDFFAADASTPERESGAHPDLFVVPFDFTSLPDPEGFTFADESGGFLVKTIQKKPAGAIRNLIVDLPPGFLGDPTAVGECSAAQLGFNACPASSQVGRIDIMTAGFAGYRGLFSVGVFNLSHPRGAITDLAFVFAGNPVHIKVSLNPANRYGIRSVVADVNETLPAFNQKLTIWGVPASSAHDSERCPEFSNDGGDYGSIGFTDKECSTDFPEAPYLTLPSECGTEHDYRIHSYDSWQETGVFGPEIGYEMPGEIEACDRPRFEPKVEIVPTGKQANTPTGLDVHIKVPQNENPGALATPPVKRTVVTLPEGMSFSPSFADGLQSCTLAQIKLFTNESIACPPASRIGEVELSTPLLPKQVVGSMYLAAQKDNPFNSTFALYLVVQDTEERGALIKIPGRIDVDPVTGQITTTFDETPQFPFDDLTLKFRSGPRAPLVNPPACGTHEIGVQIASYARPTQPVDVSSAYRVSEGPNGTPCPGSASSRPFAPKFSAGTLNPVAGSYSPFLFRLSREDSEQELSQVTTVLPPGLVAKIAGVPFCPDAALASISGAEGAGKGELSNPACPAASQVGTVSAGLGAGPGPNYFPGRVYLAGPYKGAPLSLAVVAPGIAGPFDLGNVVVRAAIRVNPETAQVTAASDPFPTILHGVILRVRDVRLRVDRPDTTINPTSCAPTAVEGQVTGVGGSLISTADDSLFNAQSPFQVGSCSDLLFKPKLSFRLFGGTKRGAHPRLKAVVRMPAGGANIAKASVALPRSEFLDQSHIGTVCTRVQFGANACPAASVYGKASVRTPLLDETLTGPIYLRSSDNLLPDLVVAFRGGRVDFNLVGRIDSVRGGIRNTFDLVPDAPVTEATFDFLGGKKGLLINSRDLCKKAYRATAKLRAHNGDALTLRPEMRNSCKKKAKRKGKRANRPKR